MPGNTLLTGLLKPWAVAPLDRLKNTPKKTPDNLSIVRRFALTDSSAGAAIDAVNTQPSMQSAGRPLACSLASLCITIT
jgi:hypothetical protein